MIQTTETETQVNREVNNENKILIGNVLTDKNRIQQQ